VAAGAASGVPSSIDAASADAVKHSFDPATGEASCASVWPNRLPASATTSNSAMVRTPTGGAINRRSRIAFDICVAPPLTSAANHLATHTNRAAIARNTHRILMY
jgi:hypothetical protein